MTAIKRPRSTLGVFRDMESWRSNFWSISMIEKRVHQRGREGQEAVFAQHLMTTTDYMNDDWSLMLRGIAKPIMEVIGRRFPNAEVRSRCGVTYLSVMARLAPGRAAVVQATGHGSVVVASPNQDILELSHHSRLSTHIWLTNPDEHRPGSLRVSPSNVSVRSIVEWLENALPSTVAISAISGT